MKILITFFFALTLITANAQLKKTNYISKTTVISNEEKSERTETKENVYISINDPDATIVINYLDRTENEKMTFRVHKKQILKEGRMHYYNLYENKWNVANIAVFFIKGEISMSLAYPEPDKTFIDFPSLKKQ